MIKGYNAYLDGEKVNDELLLTPSFTFTGLASDTDYSSRIAMTAVDFAGNESLMSTALAPHTAQTPAHAVSDQLSDTDKAAVDAIVTASMVESGQPGVLIALTGPKGSYVKAYGNTATTGGRPLTLDDHVRIGSTTKSFVGVALFKAMDDGLLSFDDTLSSFTHPSIDLTAIPNAEKITVRHMMSMRSGVYDYAQDFLTGLMHTIAPTLPYSAAEAVKTMIQYGSQFEPDTKYQYTNSNYILLGLILEVIRGKSIKSILTDDIIAAAGLTETEWPSDTAVPLPAAGSAAFNPELFGAAGALTSTIGDLSKWAQILRDHDLISADMWDIWTSWFWDYDTGWDGLRYKSEYIPLRYGYGLGAENMGTWYGHPGGIPGWGAACFFDKASGATIAVSENKATTSPVLAAQTRIFTRIANYLYPESMFDVSHPPVPKPAADLGLDAVSVAINGFQSATGQLTASTGADVFVVANWDRPSAVTTVTCGGVAMTPLGSVYHNGNAANGGVSIYRLPAAGTGIAKAISISGSGGWISAYAISLTEVTSVGSPIYATGSGTALAQAVTNTSGTTLQVFSAGAAGGPTYRLGPVLGGRNRAQQFGTNPLLWVNTTTKTGTVSATATGTNLWAAMAIHIGVTENQVFKPAGGTLALAGAAPRVTVEPANKVITPAPALLTLTGGRPGGRSLSPNGAALTLTGGVPDVRIEPSFTAFDEPNITRTDYPVPAGASGVWVTLTGKGGNGGAGAKSNSNRGGGGGGGAGGHIPRVFIPVTSLGSTYSVTCSTNATFSSGGITLTANAGGNGSASGSSSGGTGGGGGSASATGITATTIPGVSGAAGGSASSSGHPGNSGSGGGPGSGGSGGGNSTSAHGGGSGGSSDGASGGSAGGAHGNGGTGGSTADNTGGGGGGGGGSSTNSAAGDGGKGGSWGAGGGGGGSATTGTAGSSGSGGSARAFIEWV